MKRGWSVLYDRLMCLGETPRIEAGGAAETGEEAGENLP